MKTLYKVLALTTLLLASCVNEPILHREPTLKMQQTPSADNYEVNLHYIGGLSDESRDLIDSICLKNPENKGLTEVIDKNSPDEVSIGPYSIDAAYVGVNYYCNETEVSATERNLLLSDFLSVYRYNSRIITDGETLDAIMQPTFVDYVIKSEVSEIKRFTPPILEQTSWRDQKIPEKDAKKMITSYIEDNAQVFFLGSQFPEDPYRIILEKSNSFIEVTFKSAIEYQKALSLSGLNLGP